MVRFLAREEPATEPETKGEYWSMFRCCRNSADSSAKSIGRPCTPGEDCSSASPGVLSPYRLPCLC